MSPDPVDIDIVSLRWSMAVARSGGFRPAAALLGERLLICGQSAAGGVALSVLRSGGGNLFEAGAVEALQRLASLLLPILGKHASATWQRRKLLLALTSLEEIENCVGQAQEKFPRRESQVCARIIYGMSSTGIALELGISEETVMTYRKRIYGRLGAPGSRAPAYHHGSALSGPRPRQIVRMA